MSYDLAPCPAEYPHLAHDHRVEGVGYRRCKGITITDDMRARPTRERVHVLAELRWIKEILARKIGRWNVTGVDLDGGRWVPRRVEDFPENSTDAWFALSLSCGEAIAMLTMLRDYAHAQHKLVERHERAKAAAERSTVAALRGGR